MFSKHISQNLLFPKDMCHLEHLIYVCLCLPNIPLPIFFLSKLICVSFLFSKFHLCIRIKMFKAFSISCFNIFISVFASFKNLVNLCSFKLLGLFFMTQGELTDFKAIATC